MKKIFDYFVEVRSELSKVTWPKRDDVVKLTLIVVVISVIVGGFIGALDFGFTKLLEVIVR
ncbi:preprotein translocase subunit SecE [Candidatus Woesebacteria bacterium]|nr:preprotein translocase subunit SecE [Candidatus Woesebacteria bacterium]